MNSNGYREVLENHLVDIGNSIGGSSWNFQEDNAPVHQSKVNIIWFKCQKIIVLLWSSLSADLNSIKNMWRLLARKVYGAGIQLRTKKQLKTATSKSWKKITIDQLESIRC